ncbi:MAG: PIG-L family deacetylase [Bryobacterales bacterium]|nr:PIG-L family deacetylase [Bryobacterales bacterium]
MVSLSLPERGVLKVLCLGAHSDDIEIGCAATLRKLARRRGGIELEWVVLGADRESRAAEARASFEALLRGVVKKRFTVKGFRDGHFPFHGSAVKDCIEGFKRTRPDVIFTHYREDLHQDHRLVAEVSWQTFRDHLILEYEVPKYDGDLGSPNTFVGLSAAEIRTKARHILGHFASQRDRTWFTEDTFQSLARLRGVESRSRGGYAEAFYCRKLLWTI